jgi:hypothetical protein
VRFHSRLRSLLLAIAIIAASLVVTVQPAAADNHKTHSCERVALRAANGKYVSAEVSYTYSWAGMLRARADRIGPWEQFLLCDVYDVRFYAPQALFSDLDAANGWVSAEFNYSSDYKGMLRARPNSYVVDVWEEFTFVRSTCSDDCWVIRSVWNNKLVSAEIGYQQSDPRYGMLRARADVVGPWENFTMIRLA